MAWWSRAKGAPETPPQFSAQFLSSAAGRASKRTTAELLAAYQAHPWLRQVVSRISYSVASVGWELERASDKGARRMVERARGLPGGAAKIRRELRKNGDLETIDSHPMLDLINLGNDAFGGVGLRHVTTMQIDLAGESFWMPEWNGAGQPISIWPLSPAWVREVPKWMDPAGVYKVRLPGTAVETEFAAALITWLRDLSPLEPYGRGVGFASSLDDEIDADQSAAKHIRGFFLNNAIPPLIAFVEGLQPGQVADFEEKWLSKTQGVAKHRRPIFTGTKFDVKELSAKFSDMELVELRRFFGDVFQEVYGVPPEILGKVKDSNRSTIDAASTIFATYCLVPRLDRLRAGYQGLADRYQDGLLVEYDSPIPEDRDYKLRVYVAAPFAFTVDEWRELAGEEPLLDSEDGAERFAPVNTRPVDEEVGDGDPAAEPAADPDAPPDDPEEAAVELDVHGVLFAALRAVDPALIRSVVGSAALTRKITAKTRSELRHAVLAGVRTGQLVGRVEGVFAQAIEGRATGIARTEGNPALKRALREAFGAQRDAVLEAIERATAPQAAA